MANEAGAAPAPVQGNSPGAEKKKQRPRQNRHHSLRFRIKRGESL